MEIKKVWFDSENIYVQIDSGHVIGNPISWYDRLAKEHPNNAIILELVHLEKACIGKNWMKI